MIIRLDLTADVAVKPQDHTAYFDGETPCSAHGEPLRPIINHSNPEQLAPGVGSKHYFSAKPQGGNYVNYYDKVVAYVNILMGPARALDSSVSARTFDAVKDADNGPFVYTDTASSRAGIVNAANRLAGQKIAIVGLGGTGAYVLDLIAKTPVSSIRLYDGDVLQQHNAFRFPGAVPFSTLEAGPAKVDYLHSIYSEMHRGIESRPVFIDESNVAELLCFDAVFLCVDNGAARALVLQALHGSENVIFDVGMGVRTNDRDQLYAVLRMSVVDQSTAEVSKRHLPIAPTDDKNLYNTNVQVGDLNCLNAYLAVEAWKKRSGFYAGAGKTYLVTYTTASGSTAANEVPE